MATAPKAAKRAPYVKGKKSVVNEQVIGQCPGCSQDVVAKTLLGITVGEPEFDDQGNVSVSTSSEVVKVTVSHKCDGKAPETGTIDTGKA